MDFPVFFEYTSLLFIYINLLFRIAVHWHAAGFNDHVYGVGTGLDIDEDRSNGNTTRMKKRFLVWAHKGYNSTNASAHSRERILN